MCRRRGWRGWRPWPQRRHQRCRRWGRPLHSRGVAPRPASPSNGLPSSAMAVRMKLVVPLTIPRTLLSRSPASDSESGRMMGIPPPTAASKRRETPLSAAVSINSTPLAETSSLFAVTTGLACRKARNTSSPPGSNPPINSTTNWTAGSSTSSSGRSVSRDCGSPEVRGFSRSGRRRRATRGRRRSWLRWHRGRRAACAPKRRRRSLHRGSRHRPSSQRR